MTKAKKIKLIWIISCIIFILLLIFAVIFSNFNKKVAFAQGIAEENMLSVCKEFTNEKTFNVNSQTVSLDAYAEYLYNRFQLNNMSYGNKEVTDEWILNIVPIEVFQLKEEFFYMGNSYGFYCNYDKNTEKYLIYLIENIWLYNDGLLAREIKPIYYEQYVYNDQNKTVSLVYMDYYVQLNPNIKVHYYHYRKHSNYEKLYLKDVNFTGSLYNENHLNIGENMYDPYQDNGGYFVESRYRFNGVSTQSGKTDFAEAILQIGLGYIPLGTSGLTVGDVLNVTTAISELINFSDDAVNDFRGTVSNEDSYKHNKFYGMSRDKQIKKYGFPLKNASTYFKTNNTDDAVLLGINNNCYAKNEYLINFYNQSNKWNTRYVGNISLDIVKETSTIGGSKVTELASDIQAVTPTTYTVKNGEKGESTQLQESTEKEIYILKDAKHLVNFQASVNGRFTLSTFGDVSNDIIADQSNIISQNANGINQQIVFYLKQDEIIEFSIFKKYANSSNLLGVIVEFTPELIDIDEEKSVNIMPNEIEYLQYSSNEINPLDYSITSNFDASITMNLSYQNRNNSKHYTYGDNIFGSYIFDKGNYYIGIENKSDSELTVTVKLKDCIEVLPYEEEEINFAYTKIFHFKTQFTAGIEISLVTEAPILIELYDKHNTLVASSQNTTKMLKSYVDAGENYYIVLKNISHENKAVLLNIVWDSYALSLGNNNLLSVTNNQLFLYSSPPITAYFKMVSNTEFTCYNKKLEIIQANSNGEFQLSEQETYFIVFKENTESCNININISYTENKNGIFTESGSAYIRFIPTKTATYKVNGSNSYLWYNEFLQPVNAYLYANSIYYLKLNGQPESEYDVAISVNSNQIPLNTTISVNAGNYFIKITHEGTYSIRTFCANEISSTFDIYNGDGTILFENISADKKIFEIELKLGLYYIDLKVSSQTKVGVRINKY